MKAKELIQKRYHRKIRVRKSIGPGTESCPRVSIFRSSRYIYVQLIDDVKHATLVSASSLYVKGKQSKTKTAFEVGKAVAEKAVKLNVKKVVVDRGAYKYHGRVKSLVEGIREGGLTV